MPKTDETPGANDRKRQSLVWCDNEVVDFAHYLAVFVIHVAPENLPFDAFVSSDGLHMNDWSYACLAKGLGVAIAEAATRPTETASVPRLAR